MEHDGPPAHVTCALNDARRSRPALWRWMAFWTLVFVVVSLWVPVVLVEAPAPDALPTAFTTGNLVLLATVVLLAALVVPATLRIRLVIAACLLGSTLLAWALETPLREFLGGRFAVPGS